MLKHAIWNIARKGRHRLFSSRLVQFTGQTALTVVILGLLGTALAFLFTRTVIQRDEERRFEMAKQNIEVHLQARIERYLNVLRHTRAFINSKETFSREDFHLFFQNVDIRRNYPGLQGVSFIENLPANYLWAHQREVREDGFRRYRIWPQPPRRHRGRIYPVKFIEPFDLVNQRALGFDMLSESTRREAMHQARDTGHPILSGKLTLVQEGANKPRPGFLIFLPIYRRGAKTDTLTQRRAALIGLVGAPFRAQDFFEEMYSSANFSKEGIALAAYDGHEVAPESLLFSRSKNSEGKEITREGSHAANSHVNIAGHEWTLRIFSTSEFGSRADHFAPYLVAVFGLLLTFLITWVVFVTGRHAAFQRDRATSEQRARQSLESLADDLSHAVKERDLSLHRQEQMIEVGQVVSGELDVEKVVQAVTDAAVSLSNAKMGAFFYNITDHSGESYVLYALSGISREHFKNFPMPRNTDIFRPTFTGGSAVRSDDITKDSRYGHNAPYKGMPKGHPPLRSYLAVSVVSRQGEVLGGIFLGHVEAGIFKDREEKVVKALAAQAAIAIDNARLFQKNREAIETRDEFLSICSHELRTPLTSLKLQNQLVERALQQDSVLDRERFSQLVKRSGNQVDRLVRLVEEMLDISRIRSGKLAIVAERVDMISLTRETLERFAAQLQAMKCVVTLSAPAELHGDWDKLRLEQVVVNLLTNAMKYGQGKPIHIEIQKAADHVLLSVKDQGIGIAKEHQTRIFERFERAISKSEISGLGLGLYIVKQIVELHGGTIRVESELGKGSQFIVDLPLHFVQQTKQEAPKAAPRYPTLPQPPSMSV